METHNIQFIAHLTENHQLKAADALISKLKIELGADKAYIEELELENDNLKKSIKSLTEGNAKLMKQINKTSSEIVDERITKRNARITELEKEVKTLKDVRDKLLFEISKLRG